MADMRDMINPLRNAVNDLVDTKPPPTVHPEFQRGYVEGLKYALEMAEELRNGGNCDD